MIGQTYKSMSVQLFSTQLDFLDQTVNVTAHGEDCSYVMLESLTESDIEAELMLMPEDGYETLKQVVEICQVEGVAEIQFYCS